MKLNIKRIRNLWVILTILLLIGIAIREEGVASPQETKVEPRRYYWWGYSLTSVARNGTTFYINMTVVDVEDLYGWQVAVFWNTTEGIFLHATKCEEGDFLKENAPEGTTFHSAIKNEKGYAIFGASKIGKYTGNSGSGWLGTVHFLVVNPGEAPLNITNRLTYLLDSYLEDIPFDPYNGHHMQPWIEDINSDGTVDIFDLAIVAINYGKTTDIKPPEADVNGDGIVDIKDLAMVARKYGTYV